MKNNCHLCNALNSEADFVFELNQKPEKETNFEIPAENYNRKIYKCKICKVYYNSHDMLPEDLYESSYNEATYKKKILDTYNRIMALDNEKSDNKNRVKRIIQFLKDKSMNPSELAALDIGSGLCVFLGELKKYVKYTACIDPDPISANHALENVNVNHAYAGVLKNFKNENKFNLISFNKVLEHVAKPIDMLSDAKKHLNINGYIYVELPDGENALKNGDLIDREEFYIEHLTIFNKESIKFLAEKAGLQCGEIHTIHEPSDKYTLYTFMQFIK